MNHVSNSKVDEAAKLLEKAIALHEKHMDGTAPTTGPSGRRSQQSMMDMMQQALDALNGGAIKRLANASAVHQMKS